MEITERLPLKPINWLSHYIIIIIFNFIMIDTHIKQKNVDKVKVNHLALRD